MLPSINPLKRERIKFTTANIHLFLIGEMVSTILQPLWRIIMSIYICPVCGGTMIGDGFSSPSHCENLDLPLDLEADSGPYYCSDDPEFEDGSWIEDWEIRAACNAVDQIQEYEYNKYNS